MRRAGEAKERRIQDLQAGFGLFDCLYSVGDPFAFWSSFSDISAFSMVS